MSDLISREAVKAIYCGKRWRYLRNRINKLPAIDAVEVVYCDKCIYSNSCEIEGMLLGDGIEKPYCAGGERREENAAD